MRKIKDWLFLNSYKLIGFFFWIYFFLFSMYRFFFYGKLPIEDAWCGYIFWFLLGVYAGFTIAIVAYKYFDKLR